jgi:hypothetical protein
MIAARTALLVITGLVTSPVQAHWKYDSYCCSEKDCKVIPDELTPKVTPNGYVLHDLTFISKTASEVKVSPDMRWHRCDGTRTEGPLKIPYLRCLYVPSGGS